MDAIEKRYDLKFKVKQRKIEKKRSIYSRMWKNLDENERLTTEAGSFGKSSYSEVSREYRSVRLQYSGFPRSTLFQANL